MIDLETVGGTQIQTEATGLLIWQNQATYISVKTGALVFDPESLWAEMVECENLISGKQTLPVLLDYSSQLGAKAGISAANLLGETLNQMWTARRVLTNAMILLSQRYWLYPVFKTQRGLHLPSYIAYNFANPAQGDIAPDDADFLFLADESQATLITTHEFDLCARHTGRHIMGMVVSSLELDLRVEYAERMITEGKEDYIFQVLRSDESWFSDHIE